MVIAAIDHRLLAETPAGVIGILTDHLAKVSPLLRPVIDHHRLFQNRLELLHEGLVGRVGEVLGSTGFVLEGHEEQVRESLVDHLGAVVRAPLVALDGVDLFREFAEGFDDLVDLSGGGVCLELKHDDMPQKARGFRFGGFRWDLHDGNSEKDEAGEYERQAGIHGCSSWGVRRQRWGVATRRHDTHSGGDIRVLSPQVSVTCVHLNRR